MKNLILVSFIMLLLSFGITTHAQQRRIYLLNIHSQSNPDLYIRYMADLGDKVYFVYEYVNTDKDAHQISLASNYRLFDNKTGATYYPALTSLNGGFANVFPNSSQTFWVSFEGLPRVNRVSFFENDCAKSTDFCMTDIRLIDDSEDVSDSEEHYKNILYAILNTASTSTVSFYMNYPTSETEVYVDDVYQGAITKYFKNRKYVPSCGEDGCLVIKLKPGYHTFEAHSDKQTWKGSFTVKENVCLSQGLVK